MVSIVIFLLHCRLLTQATVSLALCLSGAETSVYTEYNPDSIDGGTSRSSNFSILRGAREEGQNGKGKSHGHGSDTIAVHIANQLNSKLRTQKLAGFDKRGQCARRCFLHHDCCTFLVLAVPPSAHSHVGEEREEWLAAIQPRRPDDKSAVTWTYIGTSHRWIHGHLQYLCRHQWECRPSIHSTLVDAPDPCEL